VTEQTKAEAGQTQADPDRDAAFRELLDKANRGDKQALAKLRRELDANPEIWRRAADLAAHAEGEWIALIAGGNVLASESIKRRLAELKKEVAGEHPTQLETLLADQVAVTWLAAQRGEVVASSPPGGSLGQAMFRLKQAESSQKRHLNAIKTLTTLRALVPKGLFPVDSVRLFDAERKRA